MMRGALGRVQAAGRPTNTRVCRSNSVVLPLPRHHLSVGHPCGSRFKVNRPLFSASPRSAAVCKQSARSPSVYTGLLHDPAHLTRSQRLVFGFFSSNSIRSFTLSKCCLLLSIDLSHCSSLRPATLHSSTARCVANRRSIVPMGVSWSGCCETVFWADCIEHAVVRTTKNTVTASALFNRRSPCRINP